MLRDPRVTIGGMSKLYPLGLAGESNYQPAIRACREGEPVHVCHEPDNPHDGDALRVETAGGQILGYIPRTSWLRAAIHDEGRGVAATIKSIAKSPEAGFLGVVIDVTLTDDDIRVRAYGQRPSAPPAFGISLDRFFARFRG